ncbi:DUF5397 family protein [Castellaniella sp.]|uniref:DUF5397 family protein n=1 Tax=Castellaniella sp. TaxID=1955812 RepID=UPI003C76F7CB
MEIVVLQTVTAPLPVPVSIIKTFGPFGPKYEIGELVEQLEDGDWLVEIVLMEMGEKADIVAPTSLMPPRHTDVRGSI